MDDKPARANRWPVMGDYQRKLDWQTKRFINSLASISNAGAVH
jgi:hypothetical protein